MKQTPEDRAFAHKFGDALRPKYEQAVNGPKANLTASEFAGRLGVTVGGLQKYLDGVSMPSVRTILRAYDLFGISIPYEGRPLHRAVKRSSNAEEIKLMLPLSVEAGKSQVELEIVEVTKKKPRSVQIQLKVHRAPTK